VALGTCAIDASESVWCWGLGLDGRLGTGNNNPSSVPIAVLP
jgi:hypothetical protein